MLLDFEDLLCSPKILPQNFKLTYRESKHREIALTKLSDHKISVGNPKRTRTVNNIKLDSDAARKSFASSLPSELESEGKSQFQGEVSSNCDSELVLDLDELGGIFDPTRYQGQVPHYETFNTAQFINNRELILARDNLPRDRYRNVLKNQVVLRF